MSELCPTCGQRVRVHSSGEGTNSYVGVDAARLRDVTAERERYRETLTTIREDCLEASKDHSTLGQRMWHVALVSAARAVDDALSREGRAASQGEREA